MVKISTLIVTPDSDNEERWKLHSPYNYQGRKHTVTVPQGFSTDFASVPRLLWMLLPPYGRYTVAAVVHDWLYYAQSMKRKEADRIFLSIMIEDRVRVIRAVLMYLAVRAFGWHAWRKIVRPRVDSHMERMSDGH